MTHPPSPAGPPTPAITVIVVNYNAGRHLAHCLECLVGQDFRDFRAIVVDNASTDGSFRAAQDRMAEAHPGDGRFTFVALPENRGFAAANNLAAGMAGSALLALLNPDAFPQPDWLSALHEASRRHKDVAMFGSTQIDAADPARLDGAGDVYSFLGVAWRGGHGQPLADLPGDGETFSPCAAAALYRAEAFCAAGGFDERYFCYCEDVDLAFRIQLLGGRCRQVGGAIVRHVGGASSESSGFARYHGSRNTIWTFVKNMPGVLFWLLLPGHVAFNLFLLLRAVPRGERAPVRRGMLEALRGIGPVWRERRRVQAGRRASIPTIAARLCWSLTALRQRRPLRLS